MAALLLKKKYLDCKENMEQISKDNLELMVTSVTNMMTAEKPVMFLKRCADIIVKVYTFVVLTLLTISESNERAHQRNPISCLSRGPQYENDSHVSH